MNDPENFLTRWSRRKRAVADDNERASNDEQAQRTPDAPPVERAAIDPSPLPPSDTVSAPAAPAFDLSKLPPIESITAETDIRAFLAPGVPAELRLAALRRAWVADPKVRDFVGLNDYDFDFHTPGAIPGFGALEMTDELRREVGRIVGAWQSEPALDVPTAPTASSPASEAAVPPAQTAATASKIGERRESAEATAGTTAGSVSDEPAATQDELMDHKTIAQRNAADIAPQQKHSPAENLQTLARRGHGRALPK